MSYLIIPFCLDIIKLLFALYSEIMEFFLLWALVYLFFFLQRFVFFFRVLDVDSLCVVVERNKREDARCVHFCEMGKEKFVINRLTRALVKLWWLGDGIRMIHIRHNKVQTHHNLMNKFTEFTTCNLRFAVILFMEWMWSRSISIFIFFPRNRIFKYTNLLSLALATLSSVWAIVINVSMLFVNKQNLG